MCSSGFVKALHAPTVPLAEVQVSPATRGESGGRDPPGQSASPPILGARVWGSTSSQAAGRLTARSRAPRAARCALEPGDALGGETARGGGAAGRAGRPGSRSEACSCQHGRNMEGEEAQLSALQPPQPAGAAHAQLNASGGALTLARAVCNVQRAPALACGTAARWGSPARTRRTASRRRAASWPRGVSAAAAALRLVYSAK